MVVSLHSTHSRFVSVHITYPGANENIDQIGKSTLDIYKHEKCTKQKNTAFQFSVLLWRSPYFHRTFVLFK